MKMIENDIYCNKDCPFGKLFKYFEQVSVLSKSEQKSEAPNNMA